MHNNPWRETYKDRPGSLTVMTILKETGMTRKKAAEILNLKLSTFDARMNRDSFYLRDIVILAMACDYNLLMVKHETPFIQILSFKEG